MSRSYLFVPADSEKKLSKARQSAADALILDLEDSVAAAMKPQARSQAREFIAEGAAAELWLRINPLDSEDALPDLKETLAAGPHGIVLPKPSGASDTLRLAKLLEVLEQENSLMPGVTKILPIATERPAALFDLEGYADATARLAGLTWGAEDLSAALGASATRDAQGEWLPPYAIARSLCLYAAAAAGVSAIDTVYTNFRDPNGLKRSADAARRDGFGGKLAIHPDQVAAINLAFTPSTAETARAQKIVDLFAENADCGVQSLDGEMIDKPHLLQAQKVLRMAADCEGDNG